tara:strand:+ start:479 stop:814 length:336 start_codon:yes stop_codon:yes gene_type:complete
VACFSTWCVAYVDPEIGKYYYSLIPKARYAQRQMWPSHVTVVRKDLESAEALDWNQYDGAIVEVQYENKIRFTNNYYWLDAWSKDIEKIRVSLGLPPYRFDTYHITVGNTK